MRWCQLGAFYCVLLIGFLWSALHPAELYAQASPTNQPIDIVIVLDHSRSMAYCWPENEAEGLPAYTTDCVSGQRPPSDPADLRYSAASLLVRLAEDEDRVVVIQFGRSVNPITSDRFELLGPAESRDNILSRLIPPPHNREGYGEGGYTRIDLALDYARDIFANREATERPGYVLFLTDGAPSHPNAADSDEAVSLQSEAAERAIADLRLMGVSVFAVALCNGNNCPRQFLDSTVKYNVQEARDAGELLTIFSGIFARLKPTLHVIREHNGEDISFFTRSFHGARQIIVVATRNGFDSLQGNNESRPVTPVFMDNNIELIQYESSALDEGKWVIASKDNRGFVVVRTETYPLLVHPPAEVLGSTVAPHVFPTGKDPLLIATAIGPGAGEDIYLLKEDMPSAKLVPITKDLTQREQVVPADTTNLRIQVGTDEVPLQIIRDFRLEGREGLPHAEVISPPDCVAGEPCLFAVQLEQGSEVSNLSASVYVNRVEGNSNEMPVYNAIMQCDALQRSCTEQGFSPIDGEYYRVIYTVQAKMGAFYYGDWTSTDFAISPLIRVNGLDNVLDFTRQAERIYPVTVRVSAAPELEQIGARLGARVELTRDGTPVTDWKAVLSVDVRGKGESETTLQITGPDKFPPGIYDGRIIFELTPSLPEGSPIRIVPRDIKVGFTVARPEAEITSLSIDYGDVGFEPSLNFNINEMLTVPVRFTGESFALTKAGFESNCQGLDIAVETPVDLKSDGQFVIPIKLQGRPELSTSLPVTCQGQFFLTPSAEEQLVRPTSPIRWRVVISAIEWEILGGHHEGQTESALLFTDMANVNDKAEGTLEIEYSGSGDFAVDLISLTGQADNQNHELTAEDFTFSSDIAPVPTEKGTYLLTVWLNPKTEIPHWFFWDTLYSGQAQFRIKGLTNDLPQSIPFRFHASSWPVRHLYPVVVRIFTLPVGVITYPLLVVLALVFLAWWNGRDEDEIAPLNESTSNEEPPPLREPKPLNRENRGQIKGVPSTPTRLQGVNGKSGKTQPSVKKSTLQRPAHPTNTSRPLTNNATTRRPPISSPPTRSNRRPGSGTNSTASRPSNRR